MENFGLRILSHGQYIMSQSQQEQCILLATYHADGRLSAVVREDERERREGGVSRCGLREKMSESFFSCISRD
jgi:hypothetical protein